jgi:hypothetical protein
LECGDHRRFLSFLCLAFSARHDCPRIAADFIAEEERALGRSWVAQEYERSVEAMDNCPKPTSCKSSTSKARKFLVCCRSGRLAFD